VLDYSISEVNTHPILINSSEQILLKNGSLAVYEGFTAVSAALSSTRPATLGVRFVKTLTRRLPAISRKKTSDNLPPPRREFVSFNDIGGYSGAFVTGEDSLWLITSDHGPARLFDHFEKGIYGFSKLVGGENEYVVQSRSVSLFFLSLVDRAIDAAFEHRVLQLLRCQNQSASIENCR
jgi:hypothetical protein